MKAYEYLIKISTGGAVSSLDKLKAAAGGTETGTDKLARTIRNSGGDMDRMSAKSRGLSNSLGGLKSSVMGLIGAYAGFSAVTGIAKLGMDMEQTRVSFKTMLQSAEAGNATIAKLNDFANATPFKNDQVIQAGRSLTAFKVSGDQLIPTLRRIGDISAGTGKDFNELTTIYGKAKIAGTLYAEDINQLIEAGIPVMGEFAKIMGVQESQVKKLASEGKLSFGVLEQAFTNMTSQGGMYYNLMAEQAETAGGKLSTFLGKAQDRLTKIAEAFNPVLGKLFDFGIAILDNEKALMMIATTTGIAAGAFTLYKGALLASSAAAAISSITISGLTLAEFAAFAATNGLTGAVMALNAVWALSPLGWVTTGIAAVAAAAIWAYNEFDGFRAIVDGAWEGLKAFGDGIYNFVIVRVKELLSGIGGIGKAIYQLFSSDFTARDALKTATKAAKDLAGLGSMEFAVTAGKNIGNAAVKGYYDSLYGEGDKLASAIKRDNGNGYYRNPLAIQKDNGDGYWRDPSAKADPAKDPSKAGIDGITGGGRKAVNVTVNVGKLNENIYVTSNNFQEGVSEIEDKMLDMFTRVLGSANYAAAQ